MSPAEQHLDAQVRQKIVAAHTLSNPDNAPDVPWSSIHQLLEARAAKQASAPYLVFSDEGTRHEISYAQFYARSCKVANIMHGLGLKAGDRIGTVAYNHPDTVVVYYAAWMMGLVVIPFNIGDGDDRMVYSFNNGLAKALFVMPDLAGRVAALKPQFETVEHYLELNNGDAQSPFLNLHEAELQAEATPLVNVDVSPESEALIVYTSGTTGNPKGVVLQQKNLLIDAHCIVEWYGFTPDMRALNVLPIHHVNGMVVTLLTPLYYGGSVVLSRKFSASRFWQTAAAENCVWGSVVPTVLNFLCEAKANNGEHAPDDIAQTPLKFLICGAGPLTIETVKRFEKNFPTKIIHGYGLSESTCYSCYLPFDLPEAERKKWLCDFGYPSIGVALPCNDMAIHSPEGKDVAEGDRGEIVIRGHNIMQEYFKRPDANAETFEHGWFRSGDEGFYKTDDQGRKFFFITGRLKELIIRGGINYSPLEIDEVLASIEGVKAGMAVGFEHSIYGEEIGAFIQKEEGATLTEDDVLKGCAALPFSKRPKVVLFGDEFPVTATGKYQRLKLKPLFEQWKDTQFREV